VAALLQRTRRLLCIVQSLLLFFYELNLTPLRYTAKTSFRLFVKIKYELSCDEHGKSRNSEGHHPVSE
jgi:hypothetical protein